MQNKIGVRNRKFYPKFAWLLKLLVEWTCKFKSCSLIDTHLNAYDNSASQPSNSCRFVGLSLLSPCSLIIKSMILYNSTIYLLTLELPWPSGYELRLSLERLRVSNPGESHRWMTGRASDPKMLTAPAKSQLTIGHRPNPVKTGSV